MSSRRKRKSESGTATQPKIPSSSREDVQNREPKRSPYFFHAEQGNSGESSTRSKPAPWKKRRRSEYDISRSSPSAMRTGKDPEPSDPAPEELPAAASADRTKPRPARRYREPLDIDYSTRKTREELQDALPSTVFDWALGMQEMFFNVRNRLEQEQQALVKAKQDQESDHLWMDEQEERLGELEQSLKQQGRALDEERRAFDGLRRAFQQELDEHRRGIEDGEESEEEQLGWDDRDNTDEEEHSPDDEREYVGLEEYDPDTEQCFPHDESKLLQVTRRREAYPPLSGICSQAEELMQSCRGGIKAKMTRKQWEARRGRKIIPFSYQGKAPTTAAFYTLFGLSDRNGPFVLRGRNITVEELEGRLRGTICKTIGNQTLRLRGKYVVQTWDSHTKTFTLNGFYGL